MSIEIRKPLKPADTTRMQAARSLKEFMRSVQADRTLLLLIVTGGKSHWRRKAGRAWRGFSQWISPDAMDQLWDLMVHEAGDDPQAELEAMERAGIVKMKVEKLRTLAAMIVDDAHLEQLVERSSTDPDERAIIRHYLQMFRHLEQPIES